jgi:SAM-dependent methyltransferase
MSAQANGDKEFTKYAEKEAYHWSLTYNRSFRRFSPRSHAFYDVPLRLLDRQSEGRRYVVGLDVGCGDGVMLYKAHLAGKRVVGVDYSFDGVALARRQLEARGVERPSVVHASCYRLPFDDSTFDYVSSIEVIEHLSEPEQYLSEIRRVLRPGGAAVITTPHSSQDGALHDPFHIREYTGAELRALLHEYFGRVEVWGMNSAALDRLYFRATGVGPLDKVIRGGVKVFAKWVFNPYLYHLTSSPDYGWGNLVALCHKE